LNSIANQYQCKSDDQAYEHDNRIENKHRRFVHAVKSLSLSRTKKHLKVEKTTLFVQQFLLFESLVSFSLPHLLSQDYSLVFLYLRWTWKLRARILRKLWKFLFDHELFDLVLRFLITSELLEFSYYILAFIEILILIFKTIL